MKGGARSGESGKKGRFRSTPKATAGASGLEVEAPKQKCGGVLSYCRGGWSRGLRLVR